MNEVLEKSSCEHEYHSIVYKEQERIRKYITWNQYDLITLYQERVQIYCVHCWNVIT